ncbi:hypothetical protein [Paenibacillus flagellatus]|uniref:Preprotein translocase subunit Tim44 n=1 Tax=Paenibacillus flagellatus TaxID=2211139 RepID=A0A2V5KT22_9BACL|nr:hypothetical protein [Paenibacillus flagellatus]PYI54797.1 preprotein translocase subunit Tim44 [Paenibacillus flagellatus]
MKKWMLVLMACLVVVAFSSPEQADAKPKSGGYKSGSKSYSPTTPNDGVSKTDPGKTTSNTSTPATAGTKTGGFLGGGGGFMKGLMLGGLAGMLFGGLFGGMGFFGNLLGLLVNVMAIFLVIVLVRSIYVYFRDRNKMKKRFQE